MTNEERKALVERLREDDTDPKMLNQAADTIKADGQRIAELEARLARLHTIILENSPDATIADNGMTVWDGLQNEARAALGDKHD